MSTREKAPFLHRLSDVWPPLAAIGLATGVIITLAWPMIMVKADIASRAELEGLKSRTQATEMSTLAMEKNQAITIVLLAELTDRITEAESKFRIIQIANGQYDQSELQRLLLTDPKEQE